MLITGKRVVVGVLSCYEIYFDAPDMNSACERNTVMFSKTRNATFAEMCEKLILISHSVERKKVLEMGNVYLLSCYWK